MASAPIGIIRASDISSVILVPVSDPNARFRPLTNLNLNGGPSFQVGRVNAKPSACNLHNDVSAYG